MDFTTAIMLDNRCNYLLQVVLTKATQEEVSVMAMAFTDQHLSSAKLLSKKVGGIRKNSKKRAFQFIIDNQTVYLRIYSLHFTSLIIKQTSSL